MCSYYEMNIVDQEGQSEDKFNDKFFVSPSIIQSDFYKIWNKIIQKINLDIRLSKDLVELKNLVIYDILDGTRTTLLSKSMINKNLETVFYVLNFIHTLKTLGLRDCYIMIHTSYNRERGEKEFKRILEKISIGVPLIKKYAIQNNIRCSCICPSENYELIHLLNDVIDSTKNGDFHSYFLFDYNERWITTELAHDIINTLPDIDVYVRHTKFQVSGGWIPEKMSHSVFLYSQNGTIYSNWDSDELVALVALALLAKLLHEGEVLNKIYHTQEEIIRRYKLREVNLFNKVIFLRENPKKLFIIGSPLGLYQFYY